MFIRPCYKKTNGKKLAYWALVESYRTAKGPRQRIVAYLGQLKDVVRRGVKRIAEEKNTPEGQGPSDSKDKPQFVQARLFNNDPLNNKRRLRFELRRATCELDRSGIKKKSGCCRTFWYAFWPMFCGRRLGRLLMRLSGRLKSCLVGVPTHRTRKSSFRSKKRVPGTVPPR